MLVREDFDPLAPQREAAIFYGLFLRGHSAEDLRRDIDVPRPLLNKWLHPRRYEQDFRDSLRQMYSYRKKVLAIFDELVLKEKHRVRVN
jgi:primosomal protein N''